MTEARIPTFRCCCSLLFVRDRSVQVRGDNDSSPATVVPWDWRTGNLSLVLRKTRRACVYIMGLLRVITFE